MSSARGLILVTAAAGNQGRHLVPRLVAAGHDVRAVVATEASAETVRAWGVADAVAADLSERAAVDAVMADVERVYHVGPTLHPHERAMGMHVVDSAREHGVGHVVLSSVLHAVLTDLVQHEIKRDVEEHLIGSGLEYTILQPANYMLPLKLRPVVERGVFELSWSLDRRQSMVDLADVAEVAASVLADPGPHAAATYELVAPGRFTAHELAQIISGVVGREVPAVQIDADDYLRAWVGDADPSEVSHQLAVLRSITSTYSRQDFVGNPNVLTWLLGREPTTFEQFVRRELAP